MGLIKVLGLDPDKLKYNTKSQVFDDNYGYLQVSKCPRITPGIKFIAVKYHWFRDNIQNGEFMVENIGWDVQKANIFMEFLQG